jgi:hypothetical protein
VSECSRAPIILALLLSSLLSYAWAVAEPSGTSSLPHPVVPWKDQLFYFPSPSAELQSSCPACRICFWFSNVTAPLGLVLHFYDLPDDFVRSPNVRLQLLSCYSLVSSHVELQVHPTLRHSPCSALLTHISLAYCRDCTSNYSCVDGDELLTGREISLGPFLQLTEAPYIFADPSIGHPMTLQCPRWLLQYGVLAAPLQPLFSFIYKLNILLHYLITVSTQLFF